MLFRVPLVFFYLFLQLARDISAVCSIKCICQGGCGGGWFTHESPADDMMACCPSPLSDMPAFCFQVTRRLMTPPCRRILCVERLLSLPPNSRLSRGFVVLSNEPHVGTIAYKPKRTCTKASHTYAWVDCTCACADAHARTHANTHTCTHGITK